MPFLESSEQKAEHLLIHKRHFYIGVGLFACVLLILIVLVFTSLKFSFDSDNTPMTQELISKINSLESKINDTAQKMNEVFKLKEKLDQQLPKKGGDHKVGDGKGGLYQPIEPIQLSDDNTKASKSLAVIEKSMRQIDRQLPELKDQLNQSLILLSNLPEGVPLVGAYKMTSEFGGRPDPFMAKSSLHTGVDFSAPIGTPVLSAAVGVVTKAVLNDSGYGNFIEITHGKNIVTKYAHLDQILVSKDDKVVKGSLIGTVGNTGRSTGSHLHFEIIVDNNPIDPMSVISPYPVKPNAASLGMYQASVQAKCANLKLIVNESSPLMKECLNRGGLPVDEIVVAKRFNEITKNSKGKKETGLSNSNHCTMIDEDNRLVIGTQQACQ